MNDIVRLHELRVAVPPDGEEFAKWVSLDDAADLLSAEIDTGKRAAAASERITGRRDRAED